MNKLSRAVDRFCIMHPNFGIRGLMRYIAIGNILVFLLSRFSRSPAGVYEFFSFSLAGILQGKIWQLFTFLIVPLDNSLLFLLLSCYFYYWIGSTLENQWGTAKFNVYFFSGALLTLLGTVLFSLCTGIYAASASIHYVSLAMFLAFATLFPDMQVLLFFFIPIKVKWIAYLDAAFFGYDVLMSLLARDWLGALLPVIALLNFVVFFAPHFTEKSERARYQVKRQNSAFRQETRRAQEQQKVQEQQGYRHRCAVCGRTDASDPELTFRYCSRCAGYHCFCNEHLFSHVHFTDENP